MILATANNNKDICELLINNGGNVNIKQNNGWTALHIASYNENLDICELLINN